ncbi:TrmB family transcriptional regulator [Natrialba sp. SSL1]|uniref:TrmB family transcriptional regulator n=1 Tax=Natrialba sp. SSL1 TaxID=1869245 RepID=UPI0008F803F8|nr:helix-turn-helix domain-containing protein [Natrialba sp. SSL1]OIB55600.1 TrmB family transcriptional regulator [Natrialba sp. SSL1]
MSVDNAEEAIATLVELGLTEYEARCFVALTRLQDGTAKEISQVSDIPRSRVYDTIERLDESGLVNVQQTDPRRYKATSVETACRRLREDFDSRINAAENALKQVEEPESEADEGMWAISQPDHVTDRIVTFIDSAEESIHLVVAETTVVERRIRKSIATAVDRGVEVYIEVPTEEDRDLFAESVPEDDIVTAPDLESADSVYDERPGQLLVVDRRAIVAAGIRESDLPGVTQETAVWTHGHDHGFAAWVRTLLDERVAK